MITRYHQIMTTTLLLATILLASAPDTPYQARVVGVADGDTLTALTAQHRQVRIRLHGIDAAEKD